MNNYRKLLIGAAILPVCLYGQEANDSIAGSWEKELELNEVVVVSGRPVVKQQEGKLVYLVKNDSYAKGLDGISVLGRMPRVSVNNGSVSVAGKGNVRYIIDGVLMELDATAMSMRLQNLRAEDIEKVELSATPPSRYAAEPNAVYISITTRNETLGTRGSVYGSLNRGKRLSEYFSGSISHTTRSIDMSLDASVSDYHSTNDIDRIYVFEDAGSSSRVSSTSTGSRMIDAGVNALFRYKITPGMSIGVVANYNYGATRADGANMTDYGDYTSSSVTETSSRPNNALTITGFYDCPLGNNGEMMQLTYNYFNRHSPTVTSLTAAYSNGSAGQAIREEGASDYRFHSGKADFRLPLTAAQIESGIAYTDIRSRSDYRYYAAAGDEDDIFDYNERIAAAYVSASRALGYGFSGKIGLRYEYTWTAGWQQTLSQRNKERYGQLFPTANISWNSEGVGSFNVSYSRGMGRPNLWELNSFKYYSSTDEYATGNPYLRPTLYNNAEINYYGLGGLYAVLYSSWADDGIGYVRRVGQDGGVSTVPYNCLSTNKTGLYATYKRSLFGRWEVSAGGEVYRSRSRSDLEDFKIRKMVDWSGKLEASTNVMLNRDKSLIFTVRFTHYFPWQQNLVRYGSFQLFNVTLRYALLNNRLNLHVTANDIFGWNKTRSSERYAGYDIRQTFNAHSAYVLVGVSYRFGRDKVNGIYRASKEEQSGRTK